MRPSVVISRPVKWTTSPSSSSVMPLTLSISASACAGTAISNAASAAIGRENKSFTRAFSSAVVACAITRSEEHTSELQSLMRISYAVFCLKKKNKLYHTHYYTQEHTLYYTQ